MGSNWDGEVRIAPLADHADVIGTLSDWFEREWAPYYGADGPGNAREDLQASARRDTLPMAFVAFWDGALCGTAALKHDSVTTHSHLSPWLAALLVAPPFRRRGIAGRLIEAVEAAARDMKFPHLYCGTDPLDALFQGRGWEFLERVPYFVSDVSIYRKAL